MVTGKTKKKEMLLRDFQKQHLPVYCWTKAPPLKRDFDLVYHSGQASW